MSDFPYEDIIEHAKQESPRECCGVVVVFKGRYKYIPCVNTAEDSKNEFCISTKESSDIEDKYGDIITIVHSHPHDSSAPSPTDLVAHKQSDIDWLIVGGAGDITWLKASGEKSPLYGREYMWHIHDCYNFIMDFYGQEFGIELMDFYRQDKFWERGLEPYLDNYEKAGFYTIPFSDLQYGDLILMALGTTITTHGGVYVGSNQIAHHISGRLSSKDVYGNYYRDRTTRFLRHKDMINATNNKVIW